MNIKGKTPSRVMKKLLSTVDLNPDDYLYVRMGPNQQGLIFVHRESGEKILVDNTGPGRPTVTELDRRSYWWQV